MQIDGTDAFINRSEEKPLPEYLSILQSSDRREAGATGSSQMKNITIHLAAPEVAILVETQNRNKDFRDIQSFSLYKIRDEYRKALGLA